MIHNLEDHDRACPFHYKERIDQDTCQCVTCVCKDYRPINGHGECGNCHRVPLEVLR